MEMTEKRVCARPDVLARELQGQLVVLNLDSETYFGLDSVGTRFWTVLTSTPSVRAAVDLLRDEFDVDPADLEADVCDLIDRLKEEGLVDVVDI